jgi:hypothetical protein
LNPAKERGEQGQLLACLYHANFVSLPRPKTLYGVALEFAAKFVND